MLIDKGLQYFCTIPLYVDNKDTLNVEYDNLIPNLSLDLIIVNLPS